MVVVVGNVRYAFSISVVYQEKFVSRGSTFHSGPRRSEVPRTSCATFVNWVRSGMGTETTSGLRSATVVA